MWTGYDEVLRIAYMTEATIRSGGVLAPDSSEDGLLSADEIPVARRTKHSRPTERTENPAGGIELGCETR